MKTLKDIIDFNNRNKEKELPYFGQDVFVKAEALGPLTDYKYLEALRKVSPAGADRRHRRGDGE